LTATEAQAYLPGLVSLLQDAVDGGASVGFLPPLAAVEAEAYWRSVLPAVAAGATLLFAARDAARVLGSVQLALAQRPNARHRAEVQKLLVHRNARRQGLGTALMQAAEAAARACGRSLLVLDTLQGEPSELLYQRLGYAVAGVIPCFASVADGSLQPTVVYYRLLEPEPIP
jgi:GNAT superfamily N-acetyltransferase